ncbi:MAG TPA: four helix bundle protein [Flavisolibacter sp.]|nr:four helix bundle protein [Flavisolibacter sp.]
MEEASKERRPVDIRHRCYFFAKEVVLFVGQMRFERIYFSVFEQLIRSATSIGANIVEGRSGSSRRDWKNFFVIALKSANETKYWLCLIRDTVECEKKRVENLLKEADEIAKIIARIILSSS